MHNLTALIADQTEVVSDAMARLGRSGASWVQQCTVDCVLRVFRGLGFSFGTEQTRLEALRFVVGLVVTVLGHVLQLFVVRGQAAAARDNARHQTDPSGARLQAAGICLVAWSTRRIRKLASRLHESAACVDLPDPPPSAATPPPVSVKQESRVRRAASTEPQASPPSLLSAHARPGSPTRPSNEPRIGASALRMTPLVAPPTAITSKSQPECDIAERMRPPVDRRVRAASAPL